MCINETRLDSSIENSEVGIPGYDLIRRDRNRNGEGGAIYLRNANPFMNRVDQFYSRHALQRQFVSKFKSQKVSLYYFLLGISSSGINDGIF